MRFSAIIPVVLGAQALAVPTGQPGIFDAISSTRNTINSILSDLGVSLQTNGASHGSVWNYHKLTFPQVVASLKRFKHNLVWNKNVNFGNWKTYKFNGVNLGAWLEQKKDYDIEF